MRTNLIFILIYLATFFCYSKETISLYPGVYILNPSKNIAYTQKGDKIAIISASGINTNLKIKDLTKNQLILLDTSSNVYQTTKFIGFYDSDKRIISINVDNNGIMKVFSNNLQDSTLSLNGPETDSISSIFGSNFAKVIAAVSQNNKILIIDYLNKKIAKTLLDNQSRPIYDISFTNDESMMVVETSDSIYIFETNNFQLISSFSVSSQSYDKIRFSADNKNIIKYVTDGTVLFYNVDTGDFIKYFQLSKSGFVLPQDIFITKENYLIIFKDSTEVWDLSTGNLINKFLTGKQMLAFPPGIADPFVAIGSVSLN